MNNGNANGDSLSGEESENIGKTANVSANHRRPAPPKMGRPAPPKTGPPHRRWAALLHRIINNRQT